MHTNRERAEAALRILDALPDPAFTHDDRFRPLLVNQAYLREAGISHSNLPDRPYWEIFPQGNGPFPGCQQALDEEREVTEEVPLDDGRTFLSRTFPVTDEAGSYLYSVHLFTDITSTKARERELQRRLAELRQAATAFEHSTEGIIITDPEERIVAVNHAFVQITGYEEAEVLGHTPRLLNSGLHGEQFFQAMWASLHADGVWQGEIWNRRRNGEVYPEWETISEVHDEDGTLRNYVGVFADISKARQTEEKLNFLAYHDPLTGLPNRSLFRERLEHELASLDRRKRSLAIINLDLKGFGNINDSLGPEVGDTVLKTAAQRLQGVLREDDSVSRPGGDELWVLLEDLTQGEDASKVVHQLLAALREPLEVGGRTLRLEATAGIALAPLDGTSAEELMGKAATALHRAQAGVRSSVQFFRQEMGDKAGRRLDLEHALKRAIDGEELRVWYQPQVALATGEVVAVEALVRWQHPDWGLVSPGAFIPVAEESGLIVPLGEWVLEQGVRQCAEWRAQGFALERMGINVAAAQLHNTDLPEQVADHLRRNGLPASCLELEITEEGFLSDFDQALKTLHKLAEQKTRLAIDDFGTGYSSLAYLKRLPVDTLKVDKTFVDGLPDDEHDSSIVGAILAVADHLGLEVIAEGVEGGEQARWLREKLVTKGQGFLWFKPQPPEAVTQLLGETN